MMSCEFYPVCLGPSPCVCLGAQDSHTILTTPRGVPAVLGGLLDLKSMIEKVTGKDALKNYGFYGCYCGWGGRGTPKDGTDWCCWLHDLCYGRLEEEGCGIRTQSYQYRFARGRVTCEHGPFCPVGLCACDRKLVYCLKRNLWSYNPHYQYFPNIFCS
ncbi:phospholipase A2 group V isoform X1 [Sciurus carolinensis]|uniref:phospholipase A2 group V isoform X1 n=1 Tax=Sciurus carolinensis TaxID=30640 RepID=UPI001FB23069|nr:phospholipase A2 group V isoform X1 [Sciurus carolinensis]XP_047423049.1 phospholipase A2 group V isoform X1 [Sciurus carolinensis]